MARDSGHRPACHRPSPACGCGPARRRGRGRRRASCVWPPPCVLALPPPWPWPTTRPGVVAPWWPWPLPWPALSPCLGAWPALLAAAGLGGRLSPGSSRLVTGLRGRIVRPALVQAAVGVALLVEMHAVVLTGLVDRVSNRFPGIMRATAEPVTANPASTGTTTIQREMDIKRPPKTEKRTDISSASAGAWVVTHRGGHRSRFRGRALARRLHPRRPAGVRGDRGRGRGLVPAAARRPWMSRSWAG